MTKLTRREELALRFLAAGYQRIHSIETIRAVLLMFDLVPEGTKTVVEDLMNRGLVRRSEHERGRYEVTPEGLQLAATLGPINCNVEVRG